MDILGACLRSTQYEETVGIKLTTKEAHVKIKFDQKFVKTCEYRSVLKSVYYSRKSLLRRQRPTIFVTTGTNTLKDRIELE